MCTILTQRLSDAPVYTRKYKDRVYQAHLLRRSYREDGKVKRETLGNITALGDELVAMVRAALQGQQVGVIDSLIPPVRSRAQGAVRAVAQATERLGLAKPFASRPSQERSIILALIAQRGLSLTSKLGSTRKWHETSLADQFGVSDIRVDEDFDAIDWLAARQGQMEERSAARHLTSATPLLFDLSSGCVEEKHNELAAYGHNRDTKRGRRK